MYIIEESFDQRIERLRLSVVWAEQDGHWTDEVRWRTAYLAAVRRDPSKVKSYYVILYNFVTVIIGPFITYHNAIAHAVFCIQRERGGPVPVRWEIFNMTEQEAERCCTTRAIGLVTPEEDREFTI